MQHFNSNYVLDELKEITKLNNGNSNITNIIKEDIMKICLEITSVETLFGQFCSYFNNFLSNANSKEINELYHERDIPKFFISRKDLSIGPSDWKWVDQLMYCLRMHFQSIKSYHQFMNKFNLCKDGVEYIGIFLQSLPNNYQEANFENINVYLKDCLLIMLNVTDLAEDIFQNYLKITPIYYRIRNTEKMQAKILINCCFDKVEFHANERVFVWHKDFDTNLWKVEKIIANNENAEKIFLKVPSLFLIFDGFDKEIIDKCSLLKRRLVSTWDLIKSEFQKLIVNTVDMEIELRELLQIGNMDKTISLYVLDNLVKSLDLNNDQSERVLEFQNELRNMESTENENVIVQMQKWKCLQKIIQLYNDIDLYLKHFKEIFNENHNRKECLISIKNPRYVSMAYISNISEEQASQLELTMKSDNRMISDSDETLNGTDNISELSITSITQEKELNNYKRKSNFTNKTYTSSYQLYFHESSIKQIIPTITLIKPNKFVAEATTSPQIMDIYCDDIRKVIVCDSLNGNDPTNKSIIFGSKTSNLNSILDIETAIDQNIINMDHETYIDPQTSDEKSWKEALQDDLLQTIEAKAKDISPDYIKCLMRENMNNVSRNEEMFENVEVSEVIHCSPLSGNSENRTIILGVCKADEERILNIKEALDENVINLQRQTYKVDPDKNDEISWRKAIREHLMIACEVNAEMITPEYLQCLISSKADEILNPQEIEIVGIIDTLSERIMDKAEAIASKLLDLGSYLFYDTLNSKWIPLREAIKRGYVLTRINGVDCEVHLVNVDWVKIGEKQRKVNLDEAIKEDCIDQISNMYLIEESNILMSLMDAIMFGMIHLNNKPNTDNNNGKSWLVLHRKPNDPQIEDLYNYEAANEDLNIKLISKANECDCLNEFLSFDDIKESMAKNVYLNHLVLDPLICGKEEKKSILMGCVKGEVSLEKVEKLLENLKDIFVGEIIDELSIKENGRFILEKVKEKNIINEENEILVIDDETLSIVSVSKLHGENEEKMYLTKIEPSICKAKLNQLRYLETFGIDTNEKVLMSKEKDKTKGYDMSIFEGIMKDNLDFDKVEILDSETNEMCSIFESVEKGLIGIKTAENLLDCMESLSFEELIKYGLYDPKCNSFGESVSLEKAIEAKIVEPELVFLNFLKDDKLINVKKLSEDGILNATNNEIKMENDDREIVTMKLSEAINPDVGILSTYIDSEALKQFLPTKLKVLLESNLINAEENFIYFGKSLISQMLLSDALLCGLVCDESLVRLTFKSPDLTFNEILFCDNFDVMNSIYDLNQFLEKILISLGKIKDKNGHDTFLPETFDNLLDSLLVEEKLLNENVNSLLLSASSGNIVIYEPQINYIHSTKVMIGSVLKEISDYISIQQSKETLGSDATMVNLLKDSINKLKLKLNTLNRQVKKLNKYSNDDESMQFSRNEILETCNTLKSYQSDLSDGLNLFSKLKEEFANIQRLSNLSQDKPLKSQITDIEMDIESVKSLHDNVNSQLLSLLSSLEGLLNKYSKAEKSLQMLIDNFHDLETKYKEETKHVSLNSVKLDLQSEEVSKYSDCIDDLQIAFNKLDNNIAKDFTEGQFLCTLSKEIRDYSIKISDLKTTFDIRENLLSQIKIRLLDIIKLSENFNASQEKIRSKINHIKSLDSTDETLHDMIELRKTFMNATDEFEQLKYSCESYMNNPTFQDKENIINICNNMSAAQNELYSLINEELVHQVESKVGVLLMELGKLQTFVMDLPKNWDTNIENIKEHIDEIKTYIENLQTMEKDLQNMDKVLSEDLSDHLEIDFDLLEKAIMNIQYCEKERLSTYTDLEKIYNIVSKNYLPTIITYENNKQIADNLITETNQQLEDYVQDCTHQTIYENDKESAYFTDLIKYRKANLHKLGNVLFEIEPIVEAVESYGFDLIEQLIELTSDYGSDFSILQLIKDDIQDIRQKFKALKNKISELDSKMVDLISPNSKSMSERLSSEYESWRALNDILSRLEPIQSFPEKLNKQFEEITLLWDKIKKKESLFQPFKQTINKIISDNNNMSEIQDDIKDAFDDIQIDNDNLVSNDIQELNDYLKEIESLLDSVFYKVEHRMTIISELRDLANNFWSEIADINTAIGNIKKQVMALEAFPNNKEEKSYKIHRFSSIQSDSISILTELDNKSTISSTDFELEDKLDEDFEIEISSLNITKELEPDLVNQELVKQQCASLQKMETSLKDYTDKLQTELEPKANQIIKIGGPSCELEVNEYTDTILEEIAVTEDVVEEKKIIIDKALYFVGFLCDEIKKISAWFTNIENRINNMDDAIPDQKMIELNIMELRALDAEIFSNSMKLDKVTSAISEILNYPYVPNKIMLEDLKSNICEKYEDLVRKIIDKHNELQKKYDDIGDIDFLLEDNIGILQEFENQMRNLTPKTCKGDPEYTYSCLKNLRLLTNAFKGLQPILDSLDEKVGVYGNLENKSNLRCRGTLSIFGKMKEIKDLTSVIANLIPEKEIMIQEILKNEKLISKELHAHIDYLNKLKAFLKQSPKVGLNEEAVTESNQAYINYISDFNNQRNAIELSLKVGKTLTESCPYDKCMFLSTTMKTLAHKYKRCQHLVDKRKEKLDYYSQIILEFDREKQVLLKDILELESLSLNKLSPSKITVTCGEQIKLIKMSIQKADKCFNIFENLNIRSFEIKCFGTRIDNSKLNLELREYSLKLNKVQKCLRERIRIFHQAYREDKMFSDSYANLNTWLDESYNLVESFKKEPTKVLDHLDKLKNLCNQLSCQYANFHCTIRYGTNLKDRCVSDDPEKAILIDMLKVLKLKWNKIRNLIVTEKTTINRKMIETGNIYETLKCVNYWITESINKFVPDMKVCGDIDTVEVLIDECKLAEDEANNHGKDFENLKRRMLREIRDYEESDIRNTMKNIEDQFSIYVLNVKQRSKVLEDALELAKEFNSKLDQLQNWLRKTEKQLKIKSLPKFHNEAELIELIEKHESFMKVQKEMKLIMNDFNNIGKMILNNCHPMAKNYLNRIMFSIETRWNKMNQRGEDRSKRLNESLGILRGSTALIEDLIHKIGDSLCKIQNANIAELPEDIPTINDLINKHLIFNNGLNEMDVQIKKLIKDFKLQHPPGPTNNQTKRYQSRVEFYKNIWRNSKDSLNHSFDDLTSNSRLNFLNTQFNKLWKMSIERKVALQNHLMKLNEKEQLKKFDFNTWKSDFNNFIKAKGLRLTDLFRRQPAGSAGYHTLNEFISCITKSGFPTNRSILHEVFNMFNRNNNNEIPYQEFIDAMRPERKSQIDKSINLNDKKAVTIIINDIIEQEVAECTCKLRFFVKKEDENKYRFGMNSKMYMVRYLNSTVMVRIGGGWQTITDFLKKNDPCKVEKSFGRISSTENQKIKSVKSQISGDKTGTIFAKHRSSIGSKSPGLSPRPEQRLPSISSKIPAPNISKIPKK